jgi:N-dimethylarginine dimethylaminohydrolase
MGFAVVDPGAGTWEGQGDVAIFDQTTLLFFGGRTDREGLNAALAHFDGELLVLEIREPAFHGNMALLPIPAADRILVCPDVIVGDGMRRLENRFGGERLVAVSEDEIRHYATNGLPIGKSWLAPSVVPARVKALVQSFGVEVIELEMKELCEKAGGASRCLVCHVPEQVGSVRIPDENRLAPTAAAIRSERDDG